MTGNVQMEDLRPKASWSLGWQGETSGFIAGHTQRNGVRDDHLAIYSYLSANRSIDTSVS
jgi:hypothetical protein